ncbi:MAG TPA: family 20 glycosylhydrolase [Candidatus Acidoferrales bacterium]|nr:family 20 glycosylhydrolase [Candidatus Acidoferrales bacterium]
MLRSVFLVAALASAQASPRLNLMPLPWTVTLAPGQLRIDSSFRVAATGTPDPLLQAAIDRFAARVYRQAGLAAIHPGARPVLAIDCPNPALARPTLGEDESYRLDVAPGGARLSARTVTGALRGMETFAQLIAPGPGGFQVPAIHIEDHPRYPWRGLMLDVCRHWMPIPVIERNLDALAAVKLNVFHWHLSDDQGFRVESKSLPKLHELGSDGNFYTQAEVRHILDYARARGIRVVPEFDMPGHVTSWLVGYPELGSAPGPYEIQRRWGIFEPTLDPTREEVYRFLDALIGEMAALFPDPYFHIGGDEVEDMQWKNSPAIQAFMREHHLATSIDLHHYFNSRVQDLVRKHGKIMIGWDEILAPGLASDTVIQSWRGAESLGEATRKGYRGILSAGYYLDHLLPTKTHYAADPGDGEGILGGEACMWSEYVGPETVDSRIWPRMAAIAERLWSPRQTTDVDSMYARMEAVSRTLEWVGLRHRSNYQPMLDRIAGGEPADPLRILADACEATGITVRRDARKYTSLVDLNRFVDAVRPESEFVRRLAQPDLRVTFQLWADNDRRVQALNVPELSTLSKNLSKLGAIGLEALNYIESGKPAPQDWITEQTHLLDQLEQPTAEVKLAAVRTVRMVVGQASRPARRAQRAGD